jgi:hypothetical protein
MKQKLLLNWLLSFVFLVSFALTLHGEQPRNATRLVFEGTVIRIGKAPRFVCGVTSPYRLAEYRVERVYEGKYDKREIVVDHLFCTLDVLSDIQPGDRVLVVADRQTKLPEITYDGEIRKNTDRMDRFYVARRVARSTSCCDF